MELRKHLYLVIRVLSVTLLAIIVLILLMYRNQKNLHKRDVNRLNSYSIAVELRTSSENLTKYCRSYVNTNDPQYEEAYWNVLGVRAGQLPWMDGNTISFIDSLKSLDVTSEEFELLEIARQNSNSLVWTEKTAFNAMKGIFLDLNDSFTVVGEPNPQFAREIMYNEKYHDDKKIILEPIEQFVVLLTDRTNASVDETKQYSIRLLNALIILIVLVLLFGLYSTYVTNKLVSKQIRRVKDQADVANEKTRIEVELKEEKRLNNLKSQFIATASHQFRTPLTVISSGVELIKLQSEIQGNVNDKLSPIYDKIASQIDLMTELMNDVLVLEKMNTTFSSVNKESVDLVQLLENTTRERTTLQKDNRVLELKVTGTPRAIDLDLNLMKHVLSNTIDNAFKYSEGKQNPLIDLEFTKEYVSISITDFGIGVPQADLEHIYEPFFRGSNADGISGNGLGTTIARDFVEANGGQISIESVVSEATTVQLLFNYS